MCGQWLWFVDIGGAVEISKVVFEMISNVWIVMMSIGLLMTLIIMLLMM